jgi:hypothetical protein
MGHPKQPGQDEDAHRALAERHLVTLQENERLRAELAALKSSPAAPTPELLEAGEALCRVATATGDARDFAPVAIANWKRAARAALLASARSTATGEVERLRAVLRTTHANYCTPAYTERGLHAPECLLYEVEDVPAPASDAGMDEVVEKVRVAFFLAPEHERLSFTRQCALWDVVESTLRTALADRARKAEARDA